VWQQRDTSEVQRHDVQLSFGAILRAGRRNVRQQLLARLLELERLYGPVRRLVQPQVHRVIHLRDDGRQQRQCRLLRRRHVPYQVHRELLDRLRRRLDL